MALAVINGISCWIIYFFCSRIWPGRNNSSQTMPAAGCFINFVHPGESPSSTHHAAEPCAAQRETGTPHSLALAQFPNPNLPAAQRGRPQGEGVSSPGFHPQLLSGREWSSKRWQHQGSCRSDSPWLWLAKRTAPPRSKAHSEEDRAPEVYSSSLFLRSQSDLLTMEMSCRLMMPACSTGWVCRGSFSFKRKLWPWKLEKCQYFKKKVDMRYKNALEYTYKPSGAAVNGLDKILRTGAVHPSPSG